MVTTTEMMEVDTVKAKTAKLCVATDIYCLSWY